MKQNKVSSFIILASFVVVLCCSWLLWFFLEKICDATNYENREPSVQPQLTVDNYDTFPKEYEQWFDDSMPFRNNLIKMNSLIDYIIFKKSSNDNVIIGSDNWPFYKSQSDGDPLSCYQGTNLLTTDELDEIAQNCIKQRDILTDMGKEFVILIAPNKERMYSEYMPDYYGDPSENYAAKQIADYLSETTDLRVIYLYDDLMYAKNSLNYNIFYKMDTHWNSIGAYVGASVLLKELGIIIPDIESNELTISVDSNYSGDLANMLDLNKELSFADHSYSISGYDMHEVQLIDNDFQSVISYSATGADPRKLYVLRDSFSSAMAPYIGSQFCSTYLRHRGSYTYSDFLEQDPDIVVYEVVERYIGELRSFSVMGE